MKNESSLILLKTYVTLECGSMQTAHLCWAHSKVIPSTRKETSEDQWLFIYTFVIISTREQRMSFEL